MAAQYESTDLQARVWLMVLWMYSLRFNGSARTDCRRMVVYDIWLLLLALVFMNPFRADAITASDLATLPNNSLDEKTKRLLAEIFFYVTHYWWRSTEVKWPWFDLQLDALSFSASSWRSNQGYFKMHGQPTIKRSEMVSNSLFIVVYADYELQDTRRDPKITWIIFRLFYKVLYYYNFTQSVY
jgi:hypothetical protein